MDEKEVLLFVRDRVRSAWTLELLLVLYRAPHPWRREALVRELRATDALIAENLSLLQSAGLIASTDADHYVYHPDTPALANLVAALAELYAQKPITVLRTIFTAPNDKIRSFSDAFLFKKPEQR